MKQWFFFSTLQLALATSVLVHAALLLLPSATPSANQSTASTQPLEVILVNAKSQQKPSRARAIAQANLKGGGAANSGRATSPLPPVPNNVAGEDFEPEQQSQINQLQQQQQMLLARVKSMLRTMPKPDAAPNQLSRDNLEREEKRRRLMNLLAQIERRIQIENARPRKRYISPNTRQADYAIYYDKLRHAIEDQGTQNFPQTGGRKLYGELTMIITVNYDGRVLSTEVVQGSGQRQLDRQAQLIAKNAGPFGAFNPQMRRQSEQIAVVSRFKFTREDTLQTDFGAP